MADDITDGVATTVSKADTGAPTAGPNAVSAFAAVPDLRKAGWGLPVADPHIVGVAWLNNGVLTLSNG